jgi:hypothetical protein
VFGSGALGPVVEVVGLVGLLIAVFARRASQQRVVAAQG